jgi:hypothetical protein
MVLFLLLVWWLLRDPSQRTTRDFVEGAGGAEGGNIA